MALTERTIIDKYEIVGDFKHIQCRHATIIERDGVEISRQEVQDLVAVLHADEVKAAYAAYLAAQSEGMA
jgi:hypothetical protein